MAKKDTTNGSIYVTVNNSANSRSTVLMLVVGNDTLYYNAAQDGKEQQVCYD